MEGSLEERTIVERAEIENRTKATIIIPEHQNKWKSSNDSNSSKNWHLPHPYCVPGTCLLESF